MERFNPEKTLQQIMEHATGKDGVYEAFPNNRWLDRGRDSIVYKFLEYGLVAKFYKNQGWNKNEGEYYLTNYKYYTNRAAELSLIEDWRIDAGNLKDVPLRVNFYAGLAYSDLHKSWVGFCPFITGVKAWQDNFMNNFKSEHEYLLFQRKIDEKINKSLRVQGVEMDQVNIKFFKDDYYPTGCVMVTDLCIEIKDLKIV